MEKSKKLNIAYWVATGLLCALMASSGITYFVKHNDVVKVFGELGFPSFLVYPVGIAKLLGVTAILTGKITWLKEWAYAGFFLNLLIALGAHLNTNDNEYGGAAAGLVLLAISYFIYRKQQ